MHDEWDDATPVWEPGATGEVPVSRRYRDPYYSRENGLAEARHVFLGGNRLPERWRDGAGRFTIGELGFGTGLNVVAALDAWERVAMPGAFLDIVSFEIAPLAKDRMARALAAFPEIAPLAARFLDALSGETLEADLGTAHLRVVRGDARRTVPRWAGHANAWFLDGFAPSRNPEMWEPDLLTAVAAHTCAGGTVATYSAAGAVRRALKAAGYEVFKRRGYGRKREMCAGIRRPAPGSLSAGEKGALRFR